MPTVYHSILQLEAYRSNKKRLFQILQQELKNLSGLRHPQQSLKESYVKTVSDVKNLRGRELFFQYIASGAGYGPFVELADGSVKYDLITGIGTNFFGHSNLELFEAQFDGLWGDVMQGNLGPSMDYVALMQALLDAAGPKSKMKHVWLTTCGATANEIALKIIRQKKFPATRIIAFKNCFAGRTTALQEITDNAKYREGQPTYGEVFYIPFFDPKSKDSPARQAEKSISLMQEELNRYPGRFACLEFEILQGEGGFNIAPREFLQPILKQARKCGLVIWVDEIQTFGRTGEIFCFQRLRLDEYIDVATAAKLLQVGAVLFREEYNPKPGLISGTFAGSTSGIRAGLKALEILKTQLCGVQGRIRQLEKSSIQEFERIKKGPARKHLQDYTVFGGMIAFTIFDGSLEKTKQYLFKLWDLGVIAFYCGHDPYRVRLLPPFGVMTNKQLKEVFKLLEQAMLKTAQEH